jgi:hypothetical protein
LSSRGRGVSGGGMTEGGRAAACCVAACAGSGCAAGVSVWSGCSGLAGVVWRGVCGVLLLSGSAWLSGVVCAVCAVCVPGALSGSGAACVLACAWCVPGSGASWALFAVSAGCMTWILPPGTGSRAARIAAAAKLRANRGVFGRFGGAASGQGQGNPPPWEVKVVVVQWFNSISIQVGRPKASYRPCNFFTPQKHPKNSIYSYRIPLSSLSSGVKELVEKGFYLPPPPLP